MSQDKVVVTKSKEGIGFCGLLFIVLLLLKVGVVDTQVVAWPWWVIFAPLWVPTAFALSILAVIGACVLGATLVSYFRN